jgi:bifunctional DNase/RNase
MNLEKVKIKRVIGPTPSGAAVLLGNEKKTFVVFVGFYEAAALIREINHEVPARPLTHELIQNVFLGFDLEVKHVIISTILENTFCATLILQQKVGQGNEEWVSRRNEVRIDARPSDCFVIALKNKVDIFVTREVFDQVQDVSKMTEDVEGSLTGGGLLGGQSLGELEFDLKRSEEEEESSGSEETTPGVSFLEDDQSLSEEEDEEEPGEERKGKH